MASRALTVDQNLPQYMLGECCMTTLILTIKMHNKAEFD